MEQKRNDRRVRYTRKALSEALLELMQDAPLNKITVREICQRADVNRGTFYAHFNDQYDLMNQIEEQLIREIDEATRIQEDASKAPQSNYDVICRVVTCIQKNGYLCTTLLGKNGRTEFMHRVLSVAQELCRKEWSAHMLRQERGSIEYMLSFTVYGCIGVIRDWINSGMKESPQRIARIVDNMTYRGVSAYIHEDD